MAARKSKTSSFLNVADLDVPADPAEHAGVRALAVEHIPEFAACAEGALEITQIMSALTNIVYKVRDPATEHTVIFRRFGEITFGDRILENKVFELLGEACVGPKFILGNEEWRFEECVPGRDLNTAEFREDGRVRRRAAEKLADFHRVECALLPKREPWFRTTIAAEARDLCLGDSPLNGVIPAAAEVEKELEWLMCSFRKFGADDLVFCHNDYRPANIMKVTDDELVVVDLETAGYNCRGYDLGRALNAINLNVLKTHCEWIDGGYVSKDVETDFLSAYLAKFHGREPAGEEIEGLRNEARLGSLAAILHLTLWSAQKSCSQDINWAYDRYSRDRWAQYQKFKAEWFAQK